MGNVLRDKKNQESFVFSELKCVSTPTHFQKIFSSNMLNTELIILKNIGDLCTAVEQNDWPKYQSTDGKRIVAV